MDGWTNDETYNTYLLLINERLFYDYVCEWLKNGKQPLSGTWVIAKARRFVRSVANVNWSEVTENINVYYELIPPKSCRQLQDEIVDHQEKALEHAKNLQDKLTVANPLILLLEDV